MASKKEVVSFRKTIPAGTTVTLHERIKDPGTVEEIRVRFYAGQERELHVVPLVIHKGNQEENLITYPTGTERYLSGEDDNLILPVVVPVGNDDELTIRVTNTNVTFDYTLSCDVVIDYYAGKNRVSGGVVSG